MRTLFLLALVAFGFTGCSTTSQDQSNGGVSTIPWNRPEKWEGQGPFGSMMSGGN